MSQTPTTETPDVTKTLGHWGRVLVFFLTAGFAFPHAMTEGMDLTRDEKNPPK